MSKHLQRKTMLLAVAILVCMIVTGITLSVAQSDLTFSNYDKEFDSAIAKLPTLLNEAEIEKQETNETSDAIYQSKADTIAYMNSHGIAIDTTDSKMIELADLYQVENVLAVKADGTVLAKAADTKADFTDAMFDQIKTVLSGKKDPEPVVIGTREEGNKKCYFAAKLTDDTMVVIEQEPKERDALVNDIASEEAILSNFSVGEYGYIFAVDAETYEVTYHPTSNLIGTNAADDGFDTAQLKDGNRFHGKFGGSKIYYAVSQIDDTYYVFAVPEAEMASSRAVTVAVILFTFFCVMLAVALYGVFVMRDDAEEGKREKEDRVFGKLIYNETVGRKAIVLALVGLLLVVGVTFYMQTLFALSSQSVTNADRLEQVCDTIDNNEERKETLTEQYKTWYLNKCQVAARIIEENSALANKNDLADLASTLQIASIYVIDGDGAMTASSTAQRSYKLSDDPDDSSYEFRQLLTGRTDSLVQDLSTDEVTGESYQFIGVTLHDADGYANGIVQIAVRPKRLENVLKNVQIDKVLDSVKVGASGFAFAINKDDGTIAYHPTAKYIGQTYDKLGLSTAQVSDGFSDYITIGGRTYYANCTETESYYLFVAGDEYELMSERVPLTIITAINALVCFAFIFAILTLDYGQGTEAAAAAEVAAAGGTGAEDDDDARNIEVTLADGTKKDSESAVSRWLNRSFSWEEKTPEQKLGTVLKCMGGLLAFIVFFAMMFGDGLFSSNGVFSYILNGNWERGVNIFAITAAIMYACVAIAVSSLVRWLLRLISTVVGARGETICRLLSSVVEYGTIIFMLYWCLGVLGVDTATLLASAGIVTLAIGFGAQNLINDIMSGLFIIFEGEFRVGDIIEVGGSTGTVMEIGVRTTKIKDGNDNVLVIRNSNISNVTNKTRMNSYAVCDVIIPLGESLTYVENSLQEELPNIKRRVPTIVDGPFYKGMVAMTDENVTIRVVAACTEANRSALERTLKREMGLALSKHNVAPFQTVYDHSEDIKRQETLKQKLDQAKADKFANEQKEAAKELGNSDGAAE